MKKLERTSHNWKAIVDSSQGAGSYSVEVVTAGDLVISGKCNCPAYEKNAKHGFCKHLQAVCLMIGPYFPNLFDGFDIGQQSLPIAVPDFDASPPAASLAAPSEASNKKKRAEREAPNLGSKKAKVLEGMDSEGINQLSLEAACRFLGVEVESEARRLMKDLVEEGYLDTDMKMTEKGKSAALILDQKSQSKQRKVDNGDNGGKEYVPQFRSGPFAILVALRELGNAEMTKAELLPKAQVYCDSPMQALPYGAWNAQILVEKQLLKKKSNKFSLTASGIKLADKCVDMVNKQKQADTALLSRSSSAVPQPTKSAVAAKSSVVAVARAPAPSVAWKSSSASAPSNNFFDLWEDVDDSRNKTATPNSSNKLTGLSSVVASQASVDSPVPAAGGGVRSSVTLIWDNREIQVGRHFDDNDVLFPHQRARLWLGDYIWSYQDPVSKSTALLNLVVERKKIDDLESSQFDGRYLNQLHRMQMSGMRKMYIIECASNYGFLEAQEVAFELMAQGLVVILTENDVDTACKLREISLQLAANPLELLSSFSSIEDLKIFGKDAGMTVADVWTNMLFKVSPPLLKLEKTKLVTPFFPTFALLRDAMEGDKEAAIKAVADIQGEGTQRVGPVFASRAYDICYEV